MSQTYEVAIERTGVTIMTTNDKHRAMAACIFRQITYGPLIMREVIGTYRRKVWSPERRNDQIRRERGLPTGAGDLGIPAVSA